MAYKKVTAAFQGLMKFVHQIVLSFLVEIDHDIPAKNDVKFLTGAESIHQIEPAEFDQFSQLGLDTHLSFRASGSHLEIFF